MHNQMGLSPTKSCTLDTADSDPTDRAHWTQLTPTELQEWAAQFTELTPCETMWPFCRMLVAGLGFVPASLLHFPSCVFSFPLSAFRVSPSSFLKC